ncbi:MAG: GNAT family N-acetyltransferase [Rhodospirillales bacterium]
MSAPTEPCIERIETARLKLEPFSEAFLTERYVGWLNDKRVTAHSEQRHKTHTLGSCRAFFEGMLAAGNYFWAITVKDDSALGHIGNITAYIDSPNYVADLTILIGEPAAWGRGFGAEAWIAVCDWLFANTAIRKITAGTMATNTGMIAIMKKAGMIEEGRKKRQFVQDGREVDGVYAALFKKD